MNLRGMSIAAVVLMAATGLLSVRAHAQDYPRTSDELVVSDRAPTAGATVTIQGGGCGPGASVTVMTGDGSLLEMGSADAGGDFSADLVIPAAAPGGDLEIEAVCARLGGGTHVLADEVTLTAAPIAGPLEVSTDAPAPGATVRVTGGGCAPNATVTFANSANTVFVTATADTRGDFSKAVPVPTRTEAGPLKINASCSSGTETQVLGVTVNVVAAQPAVLAFTGRSAWTTGVLATGLALAAWLLFLVGRRIRNA
ncbi:MAG: hypothetical protein OEV40_05010 [Acidimicrobiia bacterium]|nr:hypothetical protein [Acidimicrobiia bacterium]